VDNDRLSTQVTTLNTQVASLKRADDCTVFQPVVRAFSAEINRFYLDFTSQLFPRRDLWIEGVNPGTCGFGF
jgi:hypothetical protein